MDTTRLIRYGELAFPGFVVGFLAGWALVSTVALGLPLGLFGAGYGLLAAFRKMRIGAFAPMALYWLIAFPLARLIHEVLTHLVIVGRPSLPPDPWGFLLYQALISAGFAIGFLWLHERIAPRWWRRIAPRNPDAAHVYSAYAEHAKQVYEAREARRAHRGRSRAAQR